MNISTSQYNSGCESGWTKYLDQSSNSANQCHRSKGEKAKEEEEEEEDENLSMVSDASSGPPLFHQDEGCFEKTRHFCFSSSASEQENKCKKKSRIKHSGKPENPHLDDTASSSILRFSKKNMALSYNESSMQHVHGVSQGFSVTHFKGKSALKKHFGLLQPSWPGKAATEKSGES